jgi:hypothetical protein
MNLPTVIFVPQRVSIQRTYQLVHRWRDIMS